MGKFISFTPINLTEVREKILSVSPAVRLKYAVHALRAGAKPVQRVAQQIAPKLSQAVYRKGVLIRKPGTMAAAIKIRSSKDVNRTGDVGVFVNVRPAKGADRGKYSPNDPFYWRFVHFETRTNKRPVPFLTRAAGETLEGESLREIAKDLGANIQKLNGGAT